MNTINSSRNPHNSEAHEQHSGCTLDGPQPRQGKRREGQTRTTTLYGQEKAAASQGLSCRPARCPHPPRGAATGPGRCRAPHRADRREGRPRLFPRDGESPGAETPCPVCRNSPVPGGLCQPVPRALSPPGLPGTAPGLPPG